VTSEGVSSFVKFHWKPRMGLQSVVWDEAVKSNGADPDRHRRELWDAIEGAIILNGTSAFRPSIKPLPMALRSTYSIRPRLSRKKIARCR